MKLERKHSEMIKKIFKLILLTLAGAPLLFFAYALMTISMPEWILYCQSGSWIKVPAEILRAHRSEEDTVSCTYRYRFEDREYVGNRIGLSAVGDISGDSERRYQILRIYGIEEASLNALADPEKPSQSLLFREPKVSMLILPVFALALFLSGCGFLIRGLSHVTRLVPEMSLKSAGFLVAGIFSIVFLLAGVAVIVFGLSELMGYYTDKKLAAVLRNADQLTRLFSFENNFGIYMLLGTGFLFFGAGWLGLYHFAYKPHKIRKAMQAISLDPERPWRYHHHRRRFESRHSFLGKIGRSFGWGAVIGVLPSMCIVAVGVGFLFTPWGLLVLFFALLAAGHIFAGFHHIFQYLKYGRPLLILSQTPFVPDQRCLALLALKRNIPFAGRFECTVHCEGEYYHETVSAGKYQGAIVVSDVFSKTQTVTSKIVKTDNQEYYLPIYFYIPGYYPDSSIDHPKYTWTIKLRSATPGIDFEGDFHIPVYRVKHPEILGKYPDEVYSAFKKLAHNKQSDAKTGFPDSKADEIPDDQGRENALDTDSSETRFMNDILKLINLAEKRFEDIRGGLDWTFDDGDKWHHTDFLIHGSDTTEFNRPKIKEKINGEWVYECTIIGTRYDFDEMSAELKRKVNVIRETFPDSWTLITKILDTPGRGSIFKIVESNQGLSMSISLIPGGIKPHYNASFELTVHPPGQNPLEPTKTDIEGSESDIEEADFSKTKFENDIIALISHAKNRFTDILGPHKHTHNDSTKTYETDFLPEGGDTHWLHLPSIWEKPNGAWEYRYTIVPNTPDHDRLSSCLNRRVEQIRAILPDSWELTRLDFDSSDYQRRLEAKDSGNGLEISIHITPRVGKTWDASLTISVIGGED